MKKIPAFLVSLGILLVPALESSALAQQKNVISSCHVTTTAGVVEKGKCTIKSYIDGDYIMVEVYKSWDKDGTPDRMRFTNNPSCTSWIWQSERGCNEELWYGSEWNYVSTGEEEKNGIKRFFYSLGLAYTLTYDGPFPRPSNLSQGSSSINYSQLVGEWSLPGQCNIERFVYTSKDKYIWQKKVNNNWKNQFTGFYFIKDGLVGIAEEYNSEAEMIKIQSLSNKTYKGEWIPSESLTFENPEQAKFIYTRCTSK